MSRSKKPSVRKKPRFFRFGIYHPLDESPNLSTLLSHVFTDSAEDQRRIRQVFATVHAEYRTIPK